MKQMIAIVLSVFMLTMLTGCPDGLFGKKKSGGGAPAAAPPPAAPPTPQDRGGCYYDYNERRYHYDDGTNCSYDEFYDANACYNFYYDYRWNRYYNENGDPIDCNNDYIDHYGVIPYYNYNFLQGHFSWGCPGGYVAVPVGGGYYVCASDPTNQNGINNTWWFWLNY